jgi:hypothetical protein
LHRLASKSPAPVSPGTPGEARPLKRPRDVVPVTSGWAALKFTGNINQAAEVITARDGAAAGACDFPQPAPGSTSRYWCRKSCTVTAIRRKKREDSFRVIQPSCRMVFCWLKYCSSPKPSVSNNNADNLYSKVLMKQLPSGNQIVFDEELNFLMMDGLVCPPRFNLTISYQPF